MIHDSGLARLQAAEKSYDIALITAFRTKLVNCIKDKEEEGPVTKAMNLQRNRELQAILLRKGYGVTAIKGVYKEDITDAKGEDSENSFFVTNLKGDPNFKQVLLDLGEFYCQDTVIVKMKDNPAQLIGTNRSAHGLGVITGIGKSHPGVPAMFMSKIKNRPFSFDAFSNYNIGGKYSIAKTADPVIARIWNQK